MKKKRNKSGGGGGSGGMMMGMRSGFKKAAHSVTGQTESKKKKNKPLDWILTVATVLLAAYVFYKFFLK